MHLLYCWLQSGQGQVAISDTSLGPGSVLFIVSRTGVSSVHAAGRCKVYIPGSKAAVQSNSQVYS